ncbi:hypothetical protein CHS0354_012420, partial [Potamilus streckersoni]
MTLTPFSASTNCRISDCSFDTDGSGTSGRADTSNVLHRCHIISQRDSHNSCNPLIRSNSQSQAFRYAKLHVEIIAFRSLIDTVTPSMKLKNLVRLPTKESKVAVTFVTGKRFLKLLSRETVFANDYVHASNFSDVLIQYYSLGERGIRGGNSMLSYRYAHVNNRFSGYDITHTNAMSTTGVPVSSKNVTCP